MAEPREVIQESAGTLPCPVEVGPCDHLGEVRWRLDFIGRAWPDRIVLRAYDERVLLHELLHALIATDEAGVLAPHMPEHEAMVRHVTRGLWDAGWRPVLPLQIEAA